jgi:hypothetical protein
MQGTCIKISHVECSVLLLNMLTNNSEPYPLQLMLLGIIANVEFC